jgi:V/A-type H+-transporting ATPase subunit D
LQDEAQHARDELNRMLAEIYNAFATAAMLEGFDAMRRLGLAAPDAPEVRVRERNVMGVTLPLVEGKSRSWYPGYGIAAGSSESDRAIRLLLAAEEKIFEVAEIETAIYRLAMETRKTLRRERALENLFIPQYADTVKFIEESLEERERETLFNLKLIKGKKGV